MESYSTRKRSLTCEKVAKQKNSFHYVAENELVRSRKQAASARPLLENSYQTTKYKNIQSAWTPILHSEFNNKIFLERTELIGHWFSMWTDAQRKKFLSFILKRCTRSQLKFLKEGWFNQSFPIQHLDFTSVLPRFISEYILSFLDPRTLCRIAQVSWHWKFLCEQDKIWLPKCLRLGWYLPYTPSKREFGAWKNHYILCLNTLDIEPPAKSIAMYGKFCSAGQRTSSEKEKERTQKRSTVKKKMTVKEIMYFRNDKRRPPWIDTDARPKDLELADKALYRCNPNQPISRDNFRAQRLGLIPRPHQRSLTAPAYGVQPKKVTRRVRSASGGFVIGDELDKEETVDPTKLTLSEYTAIEWKGETDAAKQSSTKVKQTSVTTVRRHDITVGLHPTSHDSKSEAWTSKRNYEMQPNPAVLIISSELPACEVLLDAVMFGVVAVPYDYEAATLDSLLEKLRLALKGRQAKKLCPGNKLDWPGNVPDQPSARTVSIGIFAKGESGTIRLVEGQILTEESLTDPGMRLFWETVTTAVIPLEQGGHVDIFVPLADTERGMDLLVQLGVLTGMQFSCPTGNANSFTIAESEWLFVPDGVAPPALYFNIPRFGAWCNNVDYLQECTSLVKTNLQSYFSEEKGSLAKRLIGKIIFDALGLSTIQSLSEVTPALIDALVYLGERPDEIHGDNALQKVVSVLQTRVNQERRKTKKVKQKSVDNGSESFKRQGENSETEPPEEDEGILSGDQDTEERPPVEIGDKRMLVAHQVFHTEVEYMRSLGIVQEVFKKPLQAALSSNRAIISLANIQTIFGDVQTLHSLSCVMVDDLKNRLKKWDSHQCLGDIFIKFGTQLRAYTNFLNNYLVALSTLERCRDQSPQFRVFLERHQKHPNTKLLSLPEYFLIPGKRIHSYVQLLESFLRYTPPDHKDRNILICAIGRLKDMDTIFREYEDRLERENFLQELRRKILNCPVLAEKNRYFVVQEDVILLTCPCDGTNVKPEHRVYQQIADVGFFLFNDALVVTNLTCKYVPFRRLVNHVYKFQMSLILKKVKIEDIPDSKYVKNAFRVVSPKRLWVCQAHSWDQKQRFLATLEKAITSSVDNP